MAGRDRCDVFAGSQLAYRRWIAAVAVAVAVAGAGGEADAECAVEAAVEPGAVHGSADLVLTAVSSPGYALNAHITA